MGKKFKGFRWIAKKIGAFKKGNRTVRRQKIVNRPDTVSDAGQIGHDTRSVVDNLIKCPHGVLKVKKCAICDPEGWHEENG